MKHGELENQEVKIVEDDPNFGNLVLRIPCVRKPGYFNGKAYRELFSRYDELIHFALKSTRQLAIFVSKYTQNTGDEEVAIGIANLRVELEKMIDAFTGSRDKYMLEENQKCGYTWKELGFERPSEITKASIILESLIDSVVNTGAEITAIMHELKGQIENAPVLENSVNSMMVHIQAVDICNSITDIVKNLSGNSFLQVAHVQLAVMYYDGIVAKRMMKIQKEKK